MIPVGTWRLKGCPRCRGDVHIARDMDGWYQQCLQCGYETALPVTPEMHMAGDGHKDQSFEPIQAPPHI